MADDKTKPLVPRQAGGSSLVEIRPRTPRARVEIAPPRSKHQAALRPEKPVSQRRPVHEEPRQLPPPKLVPMGTLGDELRAQLEEARRRGDKREIERAIDAGVALGIDDEEVERVRKSRARKASAKFAGAIKAAREALEEARKLFSEISIERALHHFREAVGKATRFDLRRRSKSDILATLGTSETELDLLPDLFFTTVTIIPVGGELFYEQRRDRTHYNHKPVEQSIEVNGRMVEVVYYCGRHVIALEPTPQIAPGQPIDPPKPKIALLEDGSCRLELDNERYFMRRERSVVEDDRLVGEDRWIYYVLSDEGMYDPSSFLIGSLRHGLHHEPGQSLFVMERYIAEPLCAFLHEVHGERFCYLAVQMKFGNVVVYEVPWSDELLGTESALIEIVPAPEEPIEPITPLADFTPALPSGPTASA